MKSKNREMKCIFVLMSCIFLAFLIFPMLRLFVKSFLGQDGLTMEFYLSILTDKGFQRAFLNSFLVAGTSAVLTTAVGFFMAYTIHYTNVHRWIKSLIRGTAFLPMLLPTLTYGFAIIYSFGKQGLITRLAGRQLFEIYGFNGLLLGYVIYTLPVSFMLLNNTMGYLDKKFTVVSRIMGDGMLSTFSMTVLRPLAGTLAASLIQSFFLSFTDFGIPASVGGKFDVAASVLYSRMLGSVPDFNRGSVIAVMMLIPSAVSILILHVLEKYNVRYHKISAIEIKKSIGRDLVFGGISFLVCAGVLSVFAVIFLIPFVGDWPYSLNFSMDHIRAVFHDAGLLGVYQNSLLVAGLTALGGTLAAYGAALITARSTVSERIKKAVEGTALVTNTIPGMVLGLAFLFCFSGTELQSTFTILIVCNIVHFFSTPYLMMKSSLEKMNASWETTAMLMGDSWGKTILRVVTPNAMSTILEVFSYYFVNAMVTVSAVVFLAGARTMVMTTKIKELQYYNKFQEVFVLSLLILFTNLAAKAVFQFLAGRRSRTKERKKMKSMKKAAAAGLAGVLGLAVMFSTAGCGGNTESKEQVVIYSNADDEAVEAMKSALDANGYEGQYIFQTFGTSELGGKLLAEGADIEADLVTMSTFYVESAQEVKHMFKDLDFEKNTLEESPAYCAPITSQEGTMIVNTNLVKEKNLTLPESIKDLAKPEYQDMITVTDIASSSTAWLLIQALVSEYGEDGAREVLAAIYKNAGDHIEESGSGPLKLVRAGEAAIGFGLRQQAAADKEKGLPIDFIDPKEGNFTLTESLAVVDKGEKSNEKAMDMAECIIKNAREDLLSVYPIPLYEGEHVDSSKMSGSPKVFSEKLTVDLLKKHQELSESCKPE